MLTLSPPITLVGGALRSRGDLADHPSVVDDDEHDFGNDVCAGVSCRSADPAAAARFRARWMRSARASARAGSSGVAPASCRSNWPASTGASRESRATGTATGSVPTTCPSRRSSRTTGGAANPKSPEASPPCPTPTGSSGPCRPSARRPCRRPRRLVRHPGVERGCRVLTPTASDRPVTVADIGPGDGLASSRPPTSLRFLLPRLTEDAYAAGAEVLVRPWVLPGSDGTERRQGRR